MKRFLLFIVLFGLTVTLGAQNPKREFRGAWIQCVNGQWQGLGRDRMQSILSSQLDELQRCGINAIMFQVRAEGDALYESALEPWSRYLTGQQGLAPSPYWDPLAWMVDECHKRAMELHAWINPFRAKTKGTTALASNHYFMQHPERCFRYDGLIIFDPAYEENQAFICQVARDIVRRYDVDGIHIDDYFYPYPTAGVAMNDYEALARPGQDVGDRRRAHVNRFIERLNNEIKAEKPWVKFGVSPFGIYHNLKTRSSQIPGSATNGLQNYDDLYADVLLWMERGWMDYNIPQIYWEIGNKAADYETLIRWWSTVHRDLQAPHPCLLFIGQDVERTVKFPDRQRPAQHQMPAKYQLQRTLPAVDGSCQWYAKAVCDNPGGYGTMLRTVYHSTPALQPLMPWIDRKAPKKVRKPAIVATSDGPALMWTAPKARKPMDEAVRYAVYRFAPGERVDVKSAAPVSVTAQPYWVLPAEVADRTVFCVTAVDRLGNESKPVKVKF